MPTCTHISDDDMPRGSLTSEYAGWGREYIDALVLRDRDTDDDGDLSDERLYALQDANFNVTALADGSGVVVERYRYSPYGERTVLNANWTTHADPTSGGYAFTISFQGLMRDSETGLIYNRARMLHPAVGRFMQRDPMGAASGLALARSAQRETQVDPISLVELLETKLLGHRDFTDLLNVLRGEYQAPTWRLGGQSEWLANEYPDGMSLYQYVMSDPISLWDPFGLWNWRDFGEEVVKWGVGGGIIGSPGGPAGICKGAALGAMAGAAAYTAGEVYNALWDATNKPRGGNGKHRGNGPGRKRTNMQ